MQCLTPQNSMRESNPASPPNQPHPTRSMKTELQEGSREWLMSFRGRKCRCGCDTVATQVMTGADFGMPIHCALLLFKYPKAMTSLTKLLSMLSRPLTPAQREAVKAWLPPKRRKRR